MEHNTPKEATTHTPRRSRYIGPSAARIAKRIARIQRVRFERGWFWTRAFCHESEQDQLSFRQRPDGDGIDVRCKSAGCSRERMIRSLEQLTGESIWAAYSTGPQASASTQPSADETAQTTMTAQAGRRSWRLGQLSFMALMAVLLPAPLILGACASGACRQPPLRVGGEGRSTTLNSRHPLAPPIPRAVSSEAALLRCLAATERNPQSHALRERRRQMTAATATTTIATTPRPTLEELVDRIIDAVFGLDEPVRPMSSPARVIHEARRLRRAGESDHAIALFADLDLAASSNGERRWAYSEFLDLARRRHRDQKAQVYSPGPNRAAVLTPCGTAALQVEAVLGMSWRPGKVVSQRSLRGLRPLVKGGASCR